MKRDVYIVDAEVYEYDNSKLFNPSKKYPEGLNLDIASDSIIYDKVRNLLLLMNLDKKNIGTKYWNPFRDFIKEGNKVVIKPNLVKHINMLSSGGSEKSLITNFAIIRPIIDYCILALNGTGTIIVGDAPVQECVFDEVIKLNGLLCGIMKYNNAGYNIKLIDFRCHNNKDIKSKVVSIGKNSEFVDIDKFSDKYAITNYNLKLMHQHHRSGIHEYLIANDILEADVIINLPKPKTHRKAGITACMKNFIGVNSKKEYLPHHRTGSISSNGDEFPETSFIKNVNSQLKKYSYKCNKILNILKRATNLVLKFEKKNRYLEGSWYGNDTIWRTILDINKIILYSDKNGILNKEKQQRVVFNVADMIVSGEKEGPLLPTDKPVGLLIASFNSLNMDSVICQIMGFDPKKIKYIYNGKKLIKCKLSNNKFNIYDISGKIDATKYTKNFIPTDGWIDYLLNINSSDCE